MISSFSKTGSRSFGFVLVMVFIVHGFANAKFSTNELLIDSGWGVYWSSHALADFNNDGDMDLAVSGWDGGGNYRIRIYRNAGNGTFDPAEIQLDGNSSAYMGSVAWGDFNNDGDLDLAVCGNGSSYRFRVYTNNGLGGIGNFLEPQPGWGVYGSSLCWADFDNDGDLDLAVAGNPGGAAVVRVYTNNGDNTFRGYVEPEPGWGVSWCNISWGDYDNDGDPDLAVTGTGKVFRIYRNNGDGTFGGYFEPDPGWGVDYGAVEWADYDNDNDLDIAIAGGDASSNRFRIYKNDGNGTFSSFIEPEPGWGVNTASIAWGDYNNDGHLDIAIAGADGVNLQFRVYENQGDGTFNTNEIVPEPGWGVNRGAVAWGDFDNDGDLDLFVSGWDTGGVPRLRVYTNLMITNVVSTTNEPPSVPTGMVSEDVGGYWRLKWNSSVDDHTPSHVLRYKVAIGTNQSGVYDYASEAITYPRGQVNLGNVMNVSGRYMQTRISTDKKVFWKVCSFDGALKKSDYSTEQIAEPPPPEYDNLNSVVVAPNPFEPGSDNRDYITFYYLTPDFNMKVYSIGGGVVANIEGRSTGGQYNWYVKNNKGEPLKSGVYICYFTNAAGQEKSVKIVVIR
ncbi:MAG: VCBS repeat-containing protein [Spirochaetes bacterium]|nr:VCBS repeat-containing protein [Spirochaetota bacterium]